MNTLGRKCWQIALICFTLGLISCKQEEKGQAEAKYSVMKISANAEKEVMTSYSATIEGKQDIAIYPQVSGYIEKLCVTEGEKVREGQILFVIDQVPYKAALETAWQM